MEFGSQVKLFRFAGISLLGNTDNGHIIGLTQNGATLCERVFKGECDGSAIRESEPTLFDHLVSGCYFDKPRDCVALVSAYLHVTQRCNLECVGCYSRDMKRNQYADPSIDSLRKILVDLSRQGIKKLVISGGEPFMRDDIVEIVRIAKVECNINFVAILTNGTAMPSAGQTDIAHLVDCVSVSFDGCSEESIPHVRKKQLFSKLVATVTSFQELGAQVNILPTLHGKNIDDVSRYISLAEKLDSSISFSLLSSTPSDNIPGGLTVSKDDLKKLNLALRNQGASRIVDTPLGSGLMAKRSCGAGNQTISIDADGSVYPCHMLHSEKFLMGNALSHNLDFVLTSYVSRLFESSSPSFCSDCKKCDIRYLCGGGCRARAFTQEGSLSSRDPYCSLMQEYFGLLAEDMTVSITGEKGGKHAFS